MLRAPCVWFSPVSDREWSLHGPEETTLHPCGVKVGLRFWTVATRELSGVLCGFGVSSERRCVVDRERPFTVQMVQY